MKTTEKKAETQKQIIQSKANKQASENSILQKYKTNATQLKSSQDEELLQGKFDTLQRMQKIKDLEAKTGDDYTKISVAASEKDTSKDHHNPSVKNDRPEKRVQEYRESALVERLDTTTVQTLNRLQNELNKENKRKKPNSDLVAQLASNKIDTKSQPKNAVNNTGLPDNLKSGIENLSGYNMDDVNVHYNSSQPAALQAHAYAQGTDIHVAPGQEKHVPHEAWHVVQQKQGRVKPTKQLKGTTNINDDAGLEKEADVMGAKALQKFSKSESIPTQRQVNENVTQRMSINTGKNIVTTIKAAVPYAANRLFDLIATWGGALDNNQLNSGVLNSISNQYPFGTTDINTIALRASIANETNGSVCDNYQEMVIAEIDRSGNHGEAVRAESYPGHSYVSVIDPIAPNNRNEDLIVDAWRNMVDKRKNFTFFSKYKNNYTPYGNIAMNGATDWLNNTVLAQQYVRGFLNLNGIPNTGNLTSDMDVYKAQNPSKIDLSYVFPV